MNMILAIDPKGWTLTFVSVCVVFGVLLILYLAYSLIGEIMMRRGKISVKSMRNCRKKGSLQDSDEAEAAAIALALHCYLAENQDTGVHDAESGIITITKQ